MCCRVFKTARDDKVEPGKIGLSGAQRRVRPYSSSMHLVLHTPVSVCTCRAADDQVGLAASDT